MQDKKDDIQDDDNFEDLDFEDLDSDDDFEDESWDDFDDDTEESGDETPEADIDPAEFADSETPKKKTFIQKNFNLIIIAVVLLGGGGFVVSKFGGSPAQPQQNVQTTPDLPSAEMASGIPDNALPSEPAAIPELASDLPPMPAPIERVNDDDLALAISDIEDLNLAEEPVEDVAEAAPALSLELEDTAASEILTPLPGDLSAENDLNMLADLDLSLEEDAPMEDPGFSLSPEISEDSPVVPSEAPALPESGELLDMTAELTQEPALEDNLLEDTTAAAPELPASDGPDVQIDAQLEANISEPQDNTAQTQALQNTVADLNSALEQNKLALEDAAQTETKLSKELETANNEIASLKTTISGLQEEIQALKAAADNTASQAAKKPATPPVAPAKPKSEKSAAKTTSSSLPTPAPKPKKQVWTLRSARPGAATISTENGDMRQIETGDMVTGLGKIQSIAVENGLWVVRGTKGSVSQ